jgi:dissimilatory sulfite reductase (desulfoviridin) alpha/beta subunit
MRDFCGGWARTTVHQNFLLRWVRDEAVYDVWQRLLALGLGDAGADEVNDVISCPGTDSCKLGITSSMGLNRAVQERVESMGLTDPLTKRLHIKMSGCPERLLAAPHREHRVLRRVDQGRRAHDPGLRRAHRRPLRGRRGRPTASA